MERVFMMKNLKKMLPLTLALVLLAGCAQSGNLPDAEEEDLAFVDVGAVESGAYVDAVVLEEFVMEDEAVALVGAPAALNSMLLPEASGTAEEKNDRAVIDYSNVQDGYVMVKFTGTTQTRLKVKVIGPTTPKGYVYDLPVGEWVTFPLSDGSGDYQVKVMENTTDTKYAVVLSANFSVTLTDEFAPYLRPNQYVDYTNAANTIAMAQQLAGGVSDPLEKVREIYNYVVKNLTYDYDKAANVQTGYLPVLDDVLAAKKGICFDYAALMTGMLRSQGVPCKLVIGYAGTAYHAWVSVWSEETGWVEGAIYFDGTTWHRMDPTFASSSNGSEAIMQYIGDGSNYTVKYLY